jgi:flagellar hook-associated protein 2
VTNGLTGGTGVTFAGNAVEATDADLLVNNIQVTSDSNTLTDVLPGVTLTVHKKDPAATVGIDVTPDSAALKTKVEAFITAYNGLVKFDNDQRTAAGEGDASSIGRAPLLRQLRNSLRTELLGGHGAAAVTKLAEVGVEFTQTGTLQLHDTVFDAAVASNGADVQALFADAGGVFPAVSTLLDSYSQADGFISNAKTQLTAQVRRMDTQIANMQDRLAAQKLMLQREFAAADRAMSALNSQRDSLTNFSNSLGSAL